LIFSFAGILEFAPLGSVTEFHFDKSFDINVRGLLFTVQKALSLFQGGGSTILTASVNASKGFETTSIYSATNRRTILHALHQSEDVHVQSMIRYSHALKAYHNEKRTKTIAIMLQAIYDQYFLINQLPAIIGDTVYEFSSLYCYR
jgi:NADP-dependent 3-hydroxy acid dehydrogenase YdfG